MILIALAIVRIALTYGIFTATYDEPYHIASGMEWLDHKSYTYEWQHPPLARVALAIGPYVAGLRSHLQPSPTDEGNAILHSDGKYWRNLTLARAGNIPFLILACVVIFFWARRWFTVTAGLWALVLFTSLPPILGHAGLATLDVACGATVLLALYHFMRWLENPGWAQSVILGCAFAVALLCKFSALPFLAICCLIAILCRSKPRLAWQRALVTACTAIIVLWAGYLFTVTPLSRKSGDHASLEAQFASRPALRTLALKTVETPLPLAQFAMGLKEVADHNRWGHASYLFGQYREHGWWYFFPVVIGVKTPVGLLLLALSGFVIVALRFRTESWQHRATALFPLAILLFSMTSRIDLGVRHILPVYPFLTLLAGHAMAVSFRNIPIIRVAAILLACTAVADSLRAHPDYLAYFNQLAGNHPEAILCESDLDWGQDLHRLSLRLKELQVKSISVRYFGTADLDKAGLPPYHVLSETARAEGYVAVSLRYLTLDNAKNGAYGWLKQQTPVEKIGKSIYFYYIPSSLP